MTGPLAVLALGGGYGHACRVAAARHTLGIDGPADVVVSDPELPPALLPGCRLSSPPLSLRRDRDGLRAWIAEWLAARHPATVWVDAFPCGVLGELGPGLAPGARWELLARRVRWDRYRARMAAPSPRYARAWVTEEPGAEQSAWLHAHCGDVSPLALIDPPLPAPDVALPGRCWLVVHSGSLEEVELLVAAARRHAAGAPVVVVAPRRPERLPEGVVAWHAVAPAAPLTDRPEVLGVVTAGGASSMRQYAGRRAPHVAVPLLRPLDDQAHRVASGRNRL